MEISDQIIKVLDEVGKRFGLAIDWTQQNIVPYLQELSHKIINYEIWTSSIKTVFALVFAIGLGIILKKTVKESLTKRECVYDDNFGWILTSIILCVIAGMDIFYIMNQIIHIVTCLTLPEKILVEYIQQYLHK